jgi:S-DNA-T family DNA segregation ATPase FtsK/SpoIIIE
MLLLAAFIAGLTAPYPTPARKSDDPDPRRLRAYQRWKDILAGLAPNKDWTRVWRTSYWLWPMLGAITSLNSATWWVWASNIVCAWWFGQGIQHHIDRRTDRRHPCTGVSITAFWKNALTTERIVCATLTGATLLACGVLAYLDMAPAGLTALTPIVLARTGAMAIPDRHMGG